MTKDDVMSLLVYIIMIAFAVIVGLTIVKPSIESGLIPSGGASFLFLLVCLLIGIVLNGVLIELGHLLGAKIGGYSILSCNILSFAFYKEKEDENKLKWKFSLFKTFDGLTGETIITPEKEKAKPMANIFLPIVFFLIEVAVCIFLFNYIADSTINTSLMLVKYGFFVVTCIGAMINIYNYFPAKLDSMNGGYRLVFLNKKINTEAYNELLRVKGCKLLGTDYGDIKTFDTITDFTAKVNLLSALNYVNKDPDKTIEIVDNVINNPKNVSKSTLRDATIYKSYVYFLLNEDDKAKEIYDQLNDETKRYIRLCNDMFSIRYYLFYAYRIEKSTSEVDRALERSNKILKRILPGDKDEEVRLLQDVKERLNLK